MYVVEEFGIQTGMFFFMKNKQKKCLLEMKHRSPCSSARFRSSAAFLALRCHTRTQTKDRLNATWTLFTARQIDSSCPRVWPLSFFERWREARVSAQNTVNLLQRVSVFPPPIDRLSFIPQFIVPDVPPTHLTHTHTPTHRHNPC